VEKPLPFCGSLGEGKTITMNGRRGEGQRKGARLPVSEATKGKFWRVEKRCKKIWL